jgi:hypothetical protein
MRVSAVAGGPVIPLVHHSRRQMPEFRPRSQTTPELSGAVLPGGDIPMAGCPSSRFFEKPFDADMVVAAGKAISAQARRAAADNDGGIPGHTADAARRGAARQPARERADSVARARGSPRPPWKSSGARNADLLLRRPRHGFDRSARRMTRPPIGWQTLRFAEVVTSLPSQWRRR